MIVFTPEQIPQGSDAWLNIRLGIPTTSRFGDICTPTGKKSASAGRYLTKLLHELSTGKPEHQPKSYWMQRGNDLEPEAAAAYAAITGAQPREVGFIVTKDYRIGCSPDRLIDRDGLLEIKCPSGPKHMENAMRGSVDPQYVPQIQGQLLLTKRKWCDFFSYDPDSQPVIYRVERDEEYLAKLKSCLNEFLEDMDRSIYELEQRKWEFKINVKPREVGKVEGV